MLAELDPELTRFGFSRQADSSQYTFGGKSFDVLGAGGTSWSWQRPDDRSLMGGGAMGTAARRAAALAGQAPTEPGLPTPNTMPEGDKYRMAVEAALRARRRGASGGRRSTIAGGFGGGTPTTRAATLMGY